MQKKKTKSDSNRKEKNWLDKDVVFHPSSPINTISKFWCVSMWAGPDKWRNVKQCFVSVVRHDFCNLKYIYLLALEGFEHWALFCLEDTSRNLSAETDGMPETGSRAIAQAVIPPWPQNTECRTDNQDVFTPTKVFYLKASLFG